MPATTDVDAVIVGAGPAGLRVAGLLHAAGRSVAVLEARGRLGGRLLSAESGDGRRLDLGATWFWPNEPRVRAATDALGIPVFEQHLDGDLRFQTPSGVERVAGNPLDVASWRFARGAQSLPEALVQTVPSAAVHVEQPVDTIESTPSHLVVHSGSSTWSTPHVVLAVPPSTAVAAIRIDGLDAAVRGLAGRTPVWMGRSVKVVARYERAFWRDAGLAGAAFSHVGPLREVHDMSGPGGRPAALFGFAQPSIGASAPTRGEVLGQLGALFGPAATAPGELWIHDWRREPWTVSPDALELDDYSTYGHAGYQRPALDGRLHWASTETAPVAPGHIEGALAAAERAAAAVLGDELSDR